MTQLGLDELLGLILFVLWEHIAEDEGRVTHDADVNAVLKNIPIRKITFAPDEKFLDIFWNYFVSVAMSETISQRVELAERADDDVLQQRPPGI